MKRWIATALLGSAAIGHAQSPTPATPAPAPTASAPAPLPTSPAKKELVRRLLIVQQPGIEGAARSMVERPAMQMMQEANRILQTQVPPEKREAVGKTIEGELKKYADESTSIARDHAIKLAPSTLGTDLEQRFTEDELKTILAWMESPVNKKYQQAGGDMQSNFMQKLAAETGPLVEPKLQNLQEKTRIALGLPPPGAAPTAAAPASTPPVKATGKAKSTGK